MLLELEENTRLLNTLKQKIKEIGESLWHYKTENRTS